MKCLIITSCTGEKKSAPANQLTLSDFQKGPAHVKAREKELAEHILPAAEIYTGQQHVRLMRGIQAANGKIDVDLCILSAGYGLIPAARKVAPYECTFQGMKSREIRQWADALNVPAEFRKTVAQPFDLALILLGDSYLQACDLDAGVSFGGPTIFFCGTGVAKKLPKWPNVRVVTLSNPEAKRFSCGLVALKGEMGGRVLETLMDEGDAVQLFGSDDVLKTLANVRGRTSPPGRSARSPQEATERYYFTQHTPRRDARMLYFIPEWDDRVDPDYDFERDLATESRDPYAHDVYAHEIYQRPNYDGILVSKSVIEENARKRDRIQSIGIHAHVRVPRNFPIMGDCGAFSYIAEKVPPYTTEETIDFYERLDFDFGVSVDHLILPEHLQKTVFSNIRSDGTERTIDKASFDAEKDKGVRVLEKKPTSRDLFDNSPVLCSYQVPDLAEARRRWQITLENSKEFLAVHRKRGCKFVPIAGCQGWDIDSQTEMFRQQQEMGYDYIALGGLVRSKTAFILELLESVNRIRKPKTHIHIFGVARPEAIADFVEHGVTSVDSARFLRQAWLSATSNYYYGDVQSYMTSLKRKTQGTDDDDDAPSQWRYTAIRIPPLIREGGNTPTAKAQKTLKEGHTLSALQEQEQAVLAMAHAYANGKADLDETLKAVVGYDVFMGGDERNAPSYRKTLEDRPWQRCPCTVCQKTGIDVIIFRRNNRNRRRGFHNTWWFYQFFSAVTGSRHKANGQANGL